MNRTKKFEDEIIVLSKRRLEELSEMSVEALLASGQSTAKQLKVNGKDLEEIVWVEDADSRRSAKVIVNYYYDKSLGFCKSYAFGFIKNERNEIEMLDDSELW